MGIFGKRQPATVGINPDANPLTVRLFHIDADLTKLATQQPRTDAVRRSIDHLLDRRLTVRPAPQPQANAGCGDIYTARTGGQACEICARDIRPGETIASQPGTGGLVQHVVCPDRGGEGGAQ